MKLVSSTICTDILAGSLYSTSQSVSLNILLTLLFSVLKIPVIIPASTLKAVSPKSINGSDVLISKNPLIFVNSMTPVSCGSYVDLNLTIAESNVSGACSIYVVATCVVVVNPILDNTSVDPLINSEVFVLIILILLSISLTVNPFIFAS